jgi:tryptophanyl-tRNA synthetase
MLKTILTGDRPTGPLHIGHYFGSLTSRKAFEKEYKTFIIIADIQALTDNWDETSKVSKAVLEVATDNLALGLDLSKTTLFIQSQIPQIAELTVFFSNLVTVNRLKRNPTIKTEIEQKKNKFGESGESVTFGFLGYPVSQAADITVVRANLVPVGIDQMPVIEQGVEIIQKFNRLYKNEVFPHFEGKLSTAPKILGLDGNAKMSKSLGNCVYLKDSEEETLAKIKSAKTDSGNSLTFEPETRPEISNLVLLYSLVNEIDVEIAVQDLTGIQYGAFKQKLAQDINNYFREFRQRRLELANKPEFVRQVLENGRQTVLIEAEKTMQMVRNAMGIEY